MIFCGKLFQSLIVLGQELYLYSSHDVWSNQGLSLDNKGGNKIEPGFEVVTWKRIIRLAP